MVSLCRLGDHSILEIQKSNRAAVSREESRAQRSALPMIDRFLSSTGTVSTFNPNFCRLHCPVCRMQTGALHLQKKGSGTGEVRPNERLAPLTRSMSYLPFVVVCHGSASLATKTTLYSICIRLNEIWALKKPRPHPSQDFCPFVTLMA